MGRGEREVEESGGEVEERGDEFHVVEKGDVGDVGTEKLHVCHICELVWTVNCEKIGSFWRNPEK